MCSFEEVLKRPITHSQLLGKKERCQARSKASCKEHFKLLGQLSPHARRCMLDSLTEAQRCMLERWILRRKSLRSSKDMARMARRRVQSTSWQAAKGPGFGIHRHRRAGRITYRAGVNIGPLRLHSVYYADMAKAQSVLEVMLRIQHKIRQELAHTKHFEGGVSKCGRLEAAFRSALHSLSDPLHCTAELRFLMQIPAKRWVGRVLTTPSYSASGEGLNRGLEAWKRLSAARQVDLEAAPVSQRIRKSHYMGLQQQDATFQAGQTLWKQLRSEYFEVCVEAGQSPGHVSAKLLRWEGRPHRQLNHGPHGRLSRHSALKKEFAIAGRAQRSEKPKLFDKTPALQTHHSSKNPSYPSH